MRHVPARADGKHQALPLPNRCIGCISADGESASIQRVGVLFAVGPVLNERRPMRRALRFNANAAARSRNDEFPKPLQDPIAKGRVGDAIRAQCVRNGVVRLQLTFSTC
jgi:hypothetical protein